MAEYKMRVKVGVNEFDAEGPREFVEELFRRFEALVNSKSPSSPVLQISKETDASHSIDVVVSVSAFAKAFHQEGNRISLIGRFEGDDRELDAALLLLLGHRELRGVDAVLADEVLYGLKQTGYPIERADRIMKRGHGLGLLSFSGVRRGTKYRLTVPGAAKAKILAKELLDMFQVS